VKEIKFANVVSHANGMSMPVFFC